LRENIHDAFGKVAAEPGRTDHLAHHHNLFMLYTVFMLKVATGYRDVRAPLPRRSDIDRRNNTILVSDKDDVASFNSRILPLADVVAEQLVAVDAHLKVLASRLVLANSSLACDLYEQTGQIEGIRFKYPKIEQRAPPLFFLQRSGSSLRVEEIRPTTLKAHLTKHAPWFCLPTNANRAYLRNRLLNGIDSTFTGLPGNVVDYFMGHWVRGREPLGRFATLPVEGYIEMLRPMLNRLLECDGWSVIQGCHD
jgi:integrase